MESRTKAFSGGRYMYDLRRKNNWEQSYIEQWTRAHFGDEGVITVPQVSKFENGGVKRISFEDAVRWGAVFGLDPNEMARIFGLWDGPRDAGETDDPVVLQVADLLESFSPKQREVFLSDLEHIIWRNQVGEVKAQQTKKTSRKRPTEPPTAVPIG